LAVMVDSAMFSASYEFVGCKGVRSGWIGRLGTGGPHPNPLMRERGLVRSELQAFPRAQRPHAVGQP
jgi:hypothetical protein